MTIFEVKNADDLAAMYAEADMPPIDWDQHTWALVDAIKDHGVAYSSGPDEEWLRMACHLAVRNIDPEYRGYTPFGSI